MTPHAQGVSFGEDPPQAVLTEDDFQNIIQIAVRYIEARGTAIECRKNPSGFVRIALPPTDDLVERGVVAIRLNFWLNRFDITEACHTHPQYFESRMIHGSYTHELFVRAQPLADVPSKEDAEPASRRYTCNRMFKVDRCEDRPELVVGAVDLSCVGSQRLTAGMLLRVPRTLIHRIESADDGTLTINCVFKHSSSKNPFHDIFISNTSSVDPQTERDALTEAEKRDIFPVILNYLQESSRQNQQFRAFATHN